MRNRRFPVKTIRKDGAFISIGVNLGRHCFKAFRAFLDELVATELDFN